MVSGGQPWVFTGEHLSQVEQVAPRVAVLAGHNVRRFDVPQLERLIGTAFPAELDARVWCFPVSRRRHWTSCTASSRR